MGRKNQNTLGKPAKCSSCNEMTHSFVCVRTVQDDGSLSEEEVYCTTCRDTQEKLSRAEVAVRTQDWEW